MELAKRTGLDQSMISKMERGIQNPSIKTLQCLARVLNVSLDELAGECVTDEAA